MARLREPGTTASWKAIKTGIIRSVPPRLQAAPYQVKSIAVRDACQAVKNAKLHYKETGEFSQVDFRKRKDPRQGCFIPASAVSQTGIYPTILGPLRMAEPIPNGHKDSRLTLYNGQYHLAVPVEAQRHETETQGRVVALDPGILSRAAAKHTTVAERKCTTGVMPEGADLGVGVATGTVVGGPWEDYGPACSGAEDSVAFCRLPLRR